MDGLNMEVFEKIRALKKDKYTMKDVDTICDLLGVDLLWYQKVCLLRHLNNKDYMKAYMRNYICR